MPGVWIQSHDYFPDAACSDTKDTQHHYGCDVLRIGQRLLHSWEPEIAAKIAYLHTASDTKLNCQCLMCITKTKKKMVWLMTLTTIYNYDPL